MKTGKLMADVRITMLMRNGETEEDAQDRLYNLMYDGLCNVADHNVDFEILSQSLED